MSLKFLLRLIGMGFLIAPISAGAYLTPEQAIYDESLWLPPTISEAHDRVRMQQERSAERREREQAAYFAEQHPYIPEEQTSTQEQTEVVSTRTARLLERIDRQQQDIYGNYGLGSTLRHSRAPVTATGPESMVAGLALFGVAGWTIRRARRKMF